MPAHLDLVCEIESITIIPLARSQPGARSSGLQLHPHAVERTEKIRLIWVGGSSLATEHAEFRIAPQLSERPESTDGRAQGSMHKPATLSR